MSGISPHSVHSYHLVADQTTTRRLQSTSEVLPVTRGSDDGRNIPGVISALRFAPSATDAVDVSRKTVSRATALC